MKRFILAFPLVLAACGGEAPQSGDGEAADAAVETGWAADESDGFALVYRGDDGEVALSLSCGGDPADFNARLPGVAPIGSEERLSLGLGDTIFTLVADAEGPAEDGVRGSAPLPFDFAGLLRRGGQVSASYGANEVGPFAAPSPGLAEQLVESCDALSPAAQ